MKLPARRPERIRIERIWPQVDAGRYPVKRTLGERVDVYATFLRDGHEVLGGAVRYRAPGKRRWRELPMQRIPRTSTAGMARSSSTRSGAGSSASSRGSTAWPPGSTSSSARSRPARASSRASSRRAPRCSASPSLTVEQGLAAAAGDRSEQVVSEQTLEVLVDSERAAYGAWYELFPRSWGGFAGVEKLLPEFAKLGFDVLYLPPVHPIGADAPQGPQQRPDRAPLGSRAARGRSGARPAGTRRCTPTSAAPRSSRA